MKNDTKRCKAMAVAAVFLMVLSSFALAQGASDDSDAASLGSSWACRVTVDGNSLTTEYKIGNGSFTPMNAVKGFSDAKGDKTEGGWKYDTTTGYGPFGSFYAAFDPADSNNMVCHLNPYNLKQSIDGTDISGKNYNIMWCLPQIYLSTDGNTLIMASNDSYGGTLAPAFTLKNKDGSTTDYNYFALGVYEATYDDTTKKLGSVSSQTPKFWFTPSNFRDAAKANEKTDGTVLLWNFYQYQLYRLCSLAVMDNFDSQGQIGFGNCSNPSYAPYGVTSTGNWDTEGPYAGTSGADAKGEKLFIENAWGSLHEFVDDAYWKVRFNINIPTYTLLAGQNAVDNISEGEGGKDPICSWTDDIMFSSTFGASPSSKLSTWGLPTALTADYSATEAPDLIRAPEYGTKFFAVGGQWGTGGGAGLTCLNYFNGQESEYHGTRLAMLFNDNPGANVTVTYNTDGGSSISSETVQKGQEYTISSTVPTKGTSTFIAWWDGGANLYVPGEKITVYENITLKAIWDTYIVLVDLRGGSWSNYSEFDPENPYFVLERGTYTIPDVIPTKSGCTFMGWNSGNDTVKPGETLDVNSNIILTAVWGYEVTFDLNGGRWDQDDAVVAESGTYTVPDDTPTKSGCTFVGWMDGGNFLIPGDTIKLDSDVTLEAVWESNFVPIPDDDDDYYPIVPVTPIDTSDDSDTKTIVACAAAAVAAALAVAFFLVDSRRP